MRKGTFIAGTVFMLLMLTSILMGQAQIGGTLRGTVSDPQGAVVPGAQLTLTNPATGVMRATTSDGAGNFQFVDVPPASYDIRVALTGFQTATFQNVVVNLNEVRVLNAQLAVGAMTQEVTVSGTAESVVPQETTLRATVGERDLQQLPLNGRDFQQLVLYAPGVVRGAGANGQGSGFNVAGARGTVNNFLIDGGDANDPEVPFGTATAGGFTNGLPIDAIAQFTVITSNASAEFGRNSGATVNVVTKSGTNQVHGSVWEYHRDKSLDARNFFDPAKKSPFIQNQFGFYVGGPIWKNKTFFSGSYEGFRQVQTASNVVFVPTPAFTSSISNRLVKQIFSAYPQPAAGTIDPTNTFGTSTTQVNNGGNQDAYFVRVDHNLNQRNQLFFTFNYTPTTAQPGAQGGNGIPGTNVGLNYKNWHGVTNWNSTFGNNKLNDFRVVFQRNLLGFPLDAAPAALLQAGQLRTAGPFAWQPFSSDPGSPNGVPSISFLDQQFGSLGWSNNFPQGRVSNTFEYDDTFSWTHGKHQIKFGGSASRIQENDDFGANIRPVLSFLNTKTGLLNTESQFTYAGNQPTKYFRETDLGFFVQDTWRLTQRLNLDLGLRYELDTPLREKFNQLSNVALLDANGKPEPCARIPQNGQLSNLAIIVPHQFGLDAYCTDKNNLAPRVGFAWDIFGDSKTVVRGSYGIFYDRIFTNALANARFSPPFTIPYTLSGITYDGTVGPTTLTPTAVVSPTAIDPSLVTPYTERWNLTLSRSLDANTVLNVSYVGAKALKLAQNLNPNFGAAFADAFRPTNATTPAARSAADLANNIIRGPFGNINLRTSHAYSNFDGLEVNANHRYSHGLTFQASYVWSHSLDTISDEIAGNADSAAPQATLFNLLAPLMTPTSSCSAANGTPSGTAGQNRLLAAVRCAQNNPNLTLGQASALFVQNYVQGAPLASNYGDSSFDVRHRATGTLVYELPFGEGRHWGNNFHGLLQKVAGGWQLSSIVEAQTGNTAPLTDGVDAGRVGVTNSRPVLTGPFSAVIPFGNGGVQVNPANTTARGLAACGTTANTCPSLDFGLGVIDPTQRVGRGLLRAPGLWDFDLAGDKRFKLSERFSLQFRAEAFNLLNNVNFLRPARNLNSPATFGLITAQRLLGNTESRQIQLAARVEF